MKRVFPLCGASLAAALSLANCSSPADEINDACSFVTDVTSSFPDIEGHDGADEMVPRIDKQIDAARNALATFREANADAELQKKWQKMIDALRENREAWEASRDPGRAPGSDMVIVLRLSEKQDLADTAKSELYAAAEKSGHADCGEPIKWQY